MNGCTRISKPPPSAFSATSLHKGPLASAPYAYSSLGRGLLFLADKPASLDLNHSRLPKMDVPHSVRALRKSLKKLANSWLR